MNKKNKNENVKNSSFKDAFISVFINSINFIFKGEELTNPLSYLFLIIFPFFALVGSFVLIAYRLIKSIFRK